MSLGSTSLPPPTADELARWDAMRRDGRCSACANAGEEIHHLLSGGGLRLGHRYTVLLCRHCHSHVKARTFKVHYPDGWMLGVQDARISWPEVEFPKTRARNPARSRCTASRKTVPRPTGGFAP